MLAAHGGFHALDVVYADDRGDEMPIRSEAEYREALLYCEQEGGTWRISLELTQVEPVQDAQPTCAPRSPLRAISRPEPEPEAATLETGSAPLPVVAAGTVHEPELIIQATVDGSDTVEIAALRDKTSFATLFDRWGKPRVTYVDEEGDVITVLSENEWLEALRCGTQGGVMRINVATAPLPAPALELADAGPGSGTLVIRARGMAGERVVHTTMGAQFEEVAALIGTSELEYVDDDGDTITCSSALEWREAIRFAAHNSHGQLQLDVAVRTGLTHADQVNTCNSSTEKRVDACNSGPMPDEVLGSALHGWLLARARTISTGTPAPPSPLAFALKLAESQDWDGQVQKLTLDGSAAVDLAVCSAPELFVTETCWGTISFLRPPVDAGRCTKVSGSALLQVAHGTLVLRQINFCHLSASKVRTSRGSTGQVVCCSASSSGGTLSVKINGEGVELERGEELLIQYAA